MRGDSGKHLISRGITAGSSLTLLRLADLHWDIRKGNFDRPRSCVHLFLFVTDQAALHKWVDVGAIRVSLTGAGERDAVIGQTAVSLGVTMASAGVGGQNGPILLKTLSEIILDAIGSLFGRMQLRCVDVIADEAVCLVGPYARFLCSLSYNPLTKIVLTTNPMVFDFTALLGC